MFVERIMARYGQAVPQEQIKARIIWMADLPEQLERHVQRLQMLHRLLYGI